MLDIYWIRSRKNRRKEFKKILSSKDSKQRQGLIVMFYFYQRKKITYTITTSRYLQMLRMVFRDTAKHSKVELQKSSYSNNKKGHRKLKCSF